METLAYAATRSFRTAPVYQIKNMYNLETLLKYCSDALNWPIEEDWFEDIDDLFYDFSATDLGIKPEEFAHIRSLRQLRPLVDDQPWGIFVVDFESKKMEVSALRRILRGLIPSRSNTEFKTWDYKNILFLCFWGRQLYTVFSLQGVCTPK